TGIYRIGYQITDLQNKVLLPYTEGIRFDDINGNVGLVYDIARSTNSIFYYWVTNSKNENRYWNTKLRRNEPWNGVDARINSEAQTPDGRVRVWVLAYDIMGNSGSNNEEIILDNFAPYLEHLVIFNSKIYQAEWQGPIDDTLHLRVYSRDEFKQNELNNLKIILLFSENMNTNYNPQIFAYFERTNRTYNLNINGNWIDNDLFDGNLFFPNLNEDDTGKVILRISGVQDVAGNGLDINPKTIAGRDQNGSWLRYEQGQDQNHWFRVIKEEMEGPCVESHYPSNNSTNIPVNTKITITFTRQMNKDSTEKAISINPDFPKIFSWSNDLKTVNKNNLNV
ncbi:MAG: Ig-like domain-containing protein, partial [Thermoplasmata archaeon]